jgi:hypothetical protein
MTPRQVRRAAERKANKAARKAANGLVFSPEDAASSVVETPDVIRETPSASPPISAPQLAANRANSQLSTGPKTSEGKAKSSLNAAKTGLTGRTVLVPTDDAARYETHIRDFFKEFQPVGPRECALAQSLADTAWRLARIPALEMAIFAYGRVQFADQFADRELALQPNLIEMHTFLHYEKQLRNLQIQEGRLWRQRDKDTAELRQLQQERISKEKENLQTAAGLYTTAKHDHTPFDPAEYGFDFSVEAVEDYLKGVRAAHLLNATLKQEREQAKPHAAAA